MTEQLLISTIRLDGGTQPRAQLSDDTIAEYWEAMRRGNVFPPVEVIYDGSHYWLVDGFHRIAAVKRSATLHISANIVQGTLLDAQWRSLSVNQSHGLRRTTADKQRAIEAALRHPQGAGKSDRSIADYLGVSHHTVAKVRSELAVSGQIAQIENREVTRNGVTYTQNTAGINATRPAPVRYADDDFNQADHDDDDDAIQIDDDADDEITYDDFDPDAMPDDDDDDPVGNGPAFPSDISPLVTLLAILPAFCETCGKNRSWKLTERIGVNFKGVCPQCRTVQLLSPRQWTDAFAATLAPRLARPSLPPGYTSMAFADTLPIYPGEGLPPRADLPSTGTPGEGLGVRAKWNPGIRIYCDGCNEPHADWISKPGDAWICRKCGVIRANDTMEEWTPADRRTPNYQSPAAPKPVATPTRAAVSDHPDYDGDEWYTPPEVMAVIRSVLGGINLDPASCAEANRVVCADEFYNKEYNGLTCAWSGTVYLNPPYSQPLIGQFVDKFIEEYEAGRMTRGIMLVNNCTETGWFASLATRFPVMFGSSRIKFYNPKYEDFQTRQGQAYFYAGDDVAKFFYEMSTAGLAYAPNRVLIPGEAR